MATSDVLYSDGDKYIPAVVTSHQFRKELPQLKDVLLLGTGMGSLVYVLKRKGYNPAFTLVEKDEVVLSWAMELFGDTLSDTTITPVCEDAQSFIATDNSRYDLIFIDIFNGRYVPPFVITESFLKHCKAHLSDGGHLAMNYIVNDTDEWAKLQKLFAEIFPAYRVVSRSVNKVLLV